MRFALKAILIALLGCAAALLVACGDRSGLLSGGAAGNLQSALASVDSACAAGHPAGAVRAARRFHDEVSRLSAGSVDPRLIANLRQGALVLDALAATTCTSGTGTTATTPTTTTDTTPTPTTETTTTETTTTPTVTTPTETTPPPTATTPEPGGGTPPGGGNGNGNGPPGGVPPGQANGGAGQ